ncbi:MAG: helix-turn-helix transcriptional regulator [Oscillospiraceae bacterium]|nr:helix-turn-helix transcriptional regulator [Oscillospiraceae bacterium]
MPKVTWRTPKVNYLAAMFSAYRKARGMSSVDVAKKVGCSPQNVRVQLNKPADQWNVGQLKKHCKALDIPLEEACRAAAGIPMPQ